MMQLQQEGVRATQEVQIAGRKTAEENKRLRALLKLRGVTEAEIELFLHSDPEPDFTVTSQQQNLSLGSSTAWQHRQQRHDTSDVAPLGRSQSRELLPLPDSANNVANEGSPKADSLEDTSSKRRTERVIAPKGDNAVCPEESPAGVSGSHNSSIGGEMTSCEVAASIIAGLRGYRDVNDVREELGCTSADCTVKNMTLFEILDR
jgi:hypothetical protein